MKSAAIGSGFIPGGRKASKRLRREDNPRTRTALEYSRTMTLPAQTRFVIWKDMLRPATRT